MKKFSVLLALGTAAMLLVSGCNLFDRDHNPTSPSIPSTLERSTESPMQTDLNEAEVKKLVDDLLRSETDAQAKFERLSEAQREAVTNALQVKEIKLDVEETPSKKAEQLTSALYSSCIGRTVTRTAYNAVGWRLWAYKQQMNFCYNGWRITSTYLNRWGETYAPFWKWTSKGISPSGGNWASFYYVWSQAEFKLCAPYVTCVQHRYPYIWQKGTANGGYYWGAGG